MQTIKYIKTPNTIEGNNIEIVVIKKVNIKVELAASLFTMIRHIALKISINNRKPKNIPMLIG